MYNLSHWIVSENANEKFGEIRENLPRVSPHYLDHDRLIFNALILRLSVVVFIVIIVVVVV